MRGGASVSGSGSPRGKTDHVTQKMGPTTPVPQRPPQKEPLALEAKWRRSNSRSTWPMRWSRARRRRGGRSSSKERERLDAEASQAVQDADQGAPETPEPDPEPPAVRPEDRGVPGNHRPPAAGPAKARAAALAPGSGRPAGSPARALGLAGRSDDGEGPRRSARSAAGRRGLHSHPSRGEGHTWTPSLFLHTLWPYLNQPESPALAAPANTSNPRRARFPISSTTVTTCNPSATSSAFSWKTLVEPT